MIQIQKNFFFILLLSYFLTACEKEEAKYVIKDRNQIPELGIEYDSLVSIGSHDYYLDAFLWRDFMPMSPPDGKPLISINWLTSADSSAIPDNIVMKQQYVVYNNLVWIAQYENGVHSTPEYKVEKVSRNGPNWGPNIFVTVIAKIIDTKTNQDYYVKREKVFILRTD